jgi:hypothetical protein
LPPVATSCHQYQLHRRQFLPPVYTAGVVDNSGKFATDVNDTGIKFAAGVNDTVGK